MRLTIAQAARPMVFGSVCLQQCGVRAAVHTGCECQVGLDWLFPAWCSEWSGCVQNCNIAHTATTCVLAARGNRCRRACYRRFAVVLFVSVPRAAAPPGGATRRRRPAAPAATCRHDVSGVQMICSLGIHMDETTTRSERFVSIVRDYFRAERLARRRVDRPGATRCAKRCPRCLTRGGLAARRDQWRHAAGQVEAEKRCCRQEASEQQAREGRHSDQEGCGHVYTSAQVVPVCVLHDGDV